MVTKKNNEEKAGDFLDRFFPEGDLKLDLDGGFVGIIEQGRVEAKNVKPLFGSLDTHLQKNIKINKKKKV
jgi:hypothetical protein